MLRLPIRADLRRHVHQTIDSHGLDLLHETERKGSPYTLVCTKTRAGHQRQLAQYADDITNMRSLVTSAERVGVADTTAAGAVDQLRSAIALQPEDGN